MVVDSRAIETSDSDEMLLTFGSEPCVLLVVAHPDDETLWAGGTMLLHSDWSWRVVALCRGSDRDRRSRFFQAVRRLGAVGAIGDLDDGPDQQPLSDSAVRSAVKSSLETTSYDLIITHGLSGEYTRHLRHEEVSRAVLGLWGDGALEAKELWMFAYTDNEKAHYPRAIEDAHLLVNLPEEIWQRKTELIKEAYGFACDSWEAMTNPRRESFWRFRTPEEAWRWQTSSVTCRKGRGKPG